MRRLFICLSFLLAYSAIANFSNPTTITGENFVLSVVQDGENFNADIANVITKADAFYASGIYGQNTKVANVEAGIAWTDHLFYTNSTIGETLIPTGALKENYYDKHATGVAAIISGYLQDSSVEIPFYMSYGIAPKSEISFGGIATSFNPDGTFQISTETFTNTYKHFYQTAKSDVINSSWGNPEPTPNSFFTFYLDALSNNNNKTTLVLASGNTGPAENTVGALGLTQNTIVVGALANPNTFDQIADFSSRGASAFYNPVTKETIENVRATVHITAPGKNIVIATFDSADMTAKDYYSIADGTSFAAPMVSGVVSLLKSTSYELEGKADFVNAGWSANARDTRVIKAVLMNSASKPKDWNNNQKLSDNVDFKVEVGTGIYATSTYNNIIYTNQALDYNYGAGILDGNAALQQYVGMYTTGTANDVWVLDTVNFTSSNLYRIGQIEADTTLTATLAWFTNSEIITTDTGTEDIGNFSFANLSLEIWILVDGQYTPIALSNTSYDSIEHLSVTLAQAGEYFLRVAFFEAVYGEMTEETYALAWNLAPIPEPAVFALVIALIVSLKIRMGRKNQ